MKAKKYDPKLILQLQAVREQIDDILDRGGDDIIEKPIKPRRVRGAARTATRAAVASWPSSLDTPPALPVLVASHRFRPASTRGTRI
jgi:DNA-binding response OmpR family regulator